MTEYKKKLIEVALPLEVINRESAHEKSIRHGHPSALHHWWARRPLAACRAVLFASLVDDPSANPELFPTEEDQESERQRLFRIIENLVKWENSTDETVLAAARAEIIRSTNGNPPPVLDPFCGAGSIPLEAQRLGLDAHGSDLNPVAVLITKALIEVPPKFAGLPAVNPNAQAKLGRGDGEGVQGLADDVRYYGAWMRDEAEKRIGDLYPKAVLPKEAGGGEAAVIAWIWARTVRCPNPACGADMPLVRSFVLSAKKGKQAWVEPIVDSVAKTVGFRVVTGSGVAPESPKMGRGAKFRCLVCGDVADERHIKDEGCAGRMGAQLIAVVAEGRRGRVYLSPTLDSAEHALQANPTWKPDFTISGSTQYLGVKPYGMDEFSQLFTNRQLVALNTLSDLVVEARERVVKDAVVRGFANDAESFATGGTGATAYADAVALFLAFALDKQADLASSLCAWEPIAQCPRHVFGRQAIPMVWDYAEGNPLGNSSGAWVVCVEGIARAFERAFEHVSGSSTGHVEQLDATRAAFMPGQLVSTDPPYYDNVPYADLSDFFYVWMRRALKSVFPDLFSTLTVPKADELVAFAYRHGGKDKAEAFFLAGMTKALANIVACSDPAFPITIYYAFRQAETDDTKGTVSTGWETFLDALLKSGLSVVGTWPVRTENQSRLRGQDANALASSVVLVCRPRLLQGSLATRQEYIGALRRELPDPLRHLQHGNIAPVDLAQASIGPGMAVFSRFAKVLEADGSEMTVRTALALINEALDEILAEQEGEFDADTRWAISWFEQLGTFAGEFGVAETLCKAKNCSVQGLVDSGILEARAGKVRLLRRDELDGGWDPTTDKRLTVWEMTQHLIRRLDEGEMAAAALARILGSYAEIARDLAYRLYVICERKKWSEEGQAYNALVVAWPEIQRLAAAEPASAGPSQTSFEV